MKTYAILPTHYLFGIFVFAILCYLSACTNGAGETDSRSDTNNQIPSPGKQYVLDTSFGDNGILITDFDNNPDHLNEVHALANGGMLAIGSSFADPSDVIVIAKYLEDGSLDESFDNDGKLITDYTQGAFGYISAAVQDDGKIVISSQAPGTTYNIYVRRLNTDGSLDTTFGNRGVFQSNFGVRDTFAGKVTLQSDGKIILAAVYYNGINDSLAIARLNTNGSIDTGFGNNGYVILPLAAGFLTVTGVSQSSDGKLLFYGSISGDPSSLFLVRYRSNGTIDNTFGNSGKVIINATSVNALAGSIKTLTDGNIVASASFGYSGPEHKISVMRLLSTGDLDTSFGENGVASVLVHDGSHSCNGMIVQDDGKYVAGGTSFLSSSFDMTLVRFNSDGSIDADTGHNGITLFDDETNNSRCHSFVAQPGKKIVMGGKFDTNEDFVIVRFVETQ